MRNKSVIEQLFSQNRASLFFHPFKFYYLQNSFEDKFFKLNEDIQVLFSIPKKKIRKANDRNQIRRRMRESYRISQNILLHQEKLQLIIGIIYISSKIEDYCIINNSIQKGLLALTEHLAKNTPS